MLPSLTAIGSILLLQLHIYQYPFLKRSQSSGILHLVITPVLLLYDCMNSKFYLVQSFLEKKLMHLRKQSFTLATEQLPLRIPKIY